MAYFNDLPEMEKITVKRCMKPDKAVGDPILIIFSDGSNNAYGARLVLTSDGNYQRENLSVTSSYQRIA